MCVCVCSVYVCACGCVVCALCACACVCMCVFVLCVYMCVCAVCVYVCVGWSNVDSILLEDSDSVNTRVNIVSAVHSHGKSMSKNCHVYLEGGKFKTLECNGIMFEFLPTFKFLPKKGNQIRFYKKFCIPRHRYIHVFSDKDESGEVKYYQLLMNNSPEF